MPLQSTSAAGQIALAVILAMASFFLLLPKPKVRSLVGGTAAGIAALAVFAMWLVQSFTKPTQDVVGTALFIFFAAGALIFGTLLVVQRNPARGAIAFAFVILSTCGLFLLLAAPFLMAATIIIYAGAIIVTFLFVLMLSHAGGPSDENDRSREPMLGSLAGFAFVGLVLFTLYKNAPPVIAKENPKPAPPLPALVLTDAEKAKLAATITELDASAAQLRTLNVKDEPAVEKWHESLKTVLVSQFKEDLGTADRLQFRADSQANAMKSRISDPAGVNRQMAVLNMGIQESLDGTKPFDSAAIEKDLVTLRDELRLLYGSSELPARNVANLGVLLYSEHLLAVELTGTLLLVATIGAVAITNRKGVTA